MNNRVLRLLMVFTALLFTAIQAFAASNPVPKKNAKLQVSGPASIALQGIPKYAPDRLLVKFRPGMAASERGKAHRQAGGKQLRVIPGIGVHVVEVPAGSVPGKVSQYQKNPNVEYAEPDYYRVLIIPDEGNDPGVPSGVIAGRGYFAEQWGLNNTGQQHTAIVGGSATQVDGIPDADIDAPEGWDITNGDASVKIAILDTGIDCDSVEHSGKCVEEISFVEDYSDYLDDPEDYVGHGTHVAGISAVHTNNGIGVSGVGWNTSLGNLKTCFAYELDLLPPWGYYVTVGVCPISSSVAAITYAANNGYHVINMSYGSDLVDELGNPIGLSLPPNAETDAVNYAWNKGVVLVAAAGNDGDTTRMYPAANENVIAVAATDHADNLASFTSGGSNYSVPGDHWVSLMAPGKDILSTNPVADCVFLAEYVYFVPFDPETEGCLSWKSGTSMASPHVAGAAALVWGRLFPGQSPQSCISPSGVPCNQVVRNHLEFGADASGAITQNLLSWSQHGRLNLYGALSIVDTDLDGLPDSIDNDDDQDGLSDIDEAQLGTNPIVSDSDDDGLNDFDEVNLDGSPTDYSVGVDTDPLNPDTDGDQIKDGTELLAGYDPLNGADTPVWGDIDNNGVVNAADVLLATRAALGLVSLDDAQLARGNVAPLVGGVPDSSPEDEFTVADLMLITGKAAGSISF